MLPELFRIPLIDRPIHSYGLMLVIGFFLALQLARVLARRSGQDPDAFTNIALIALFSGIVGARLSHVIENWGDYARFPDLSFTQNAWNAINLTSGGLTYYGGVLLALPACIAYGLYKHIPIRLGMDIIAPCLMIGLGFGRVGCFLNGCCHGAECDLFAPLGVQYPYYSNAYIEQYREGHLPHDPPHGLVNETFSGPRLKSPAEIARSPELQALAAKERSSPVHNAQIYSTVTALLLAAMLTAFFTLPHAAGRVFALMMILEGGTRFLLEMLRSEPLQVGPLTLSQAIGIALFVGGAALWIVFGLADRSNGVSRRITVSPA